MNKISLVVLFLGSLNLAFAQTHEWKSDTNKVYHLNDFHPGEFENVKVEKICTQEEATSFVIWVKDNVPAHYHKHHNETLNFLEGEGVFTVGGVKHEVKPGDFITIPKTVVHEFKTTSKTPVKVISIQAPEFLGKDIIWIKSP